MLAILKNANLALRFIIELCALAAYGYWGFHLNRALIYKIVLGFGTPLAAAVLWGLFGSPKANFPVSGMLKLGIEVVVFGLPALALYAAGSPALAWIYGCVFIVNSVLLIIWSQ